MKKWIVLLLVGACVTAEAQKTKDHWVTFQYEQLPTEPLSKQIVSYQSTLYSWEDEKAVSLEAQYTQELEAYRANYKLAQEQYKKEMDEYNRKTRFEKIVDKELLEQSKPVFNPPPYPEFKEIPKSPDNDALVAKYLTLEGYKKGIDTPVFITVTLKELELPEPEVKTTTTGEGENMKTTTTYKNRYRQPVKLTVESVVDGILYDQILPISNEYYFYSTSYRPTPHEVKQAAVDDLLSYTRNFINNRWGKRTIELNTSIVRIEKFRNYQYPEFEQALAPALSGYKNLLLDKPKAISSFHQAINIWEKVLLEYDPSNKKARINREVAWYTMLNLAEAYTWIEDYSKADEYFSLMEATMPSWSTRPRLVESKERLQNFRQRAKSNQ